ncbi:MAG: hypothetical protein A2Y72_03280 [Chloroflexi bacterium RBG_13_53_26]|nr:MAG: hypothetical protein A2Y72_03280 [Chloroflexi bacterium RBG_13_53_26]
MSETRRADHVIREVFGSPIIGQGVALTISGVSARTDSGFTAGDIILVSPSVSCWGAFCSSTGTAVDDGSCTFLPALSAQVFSVPDNATYFCTIEFDSDDGGGILSLMPLAGYRVP